MAKKASKKAKAPAMAREPVLNKGQTRKLEAFRKSVKGDEKATQAMFKIWMDAQPLKGSSAAPDAVAIKLVDALAPLVKDKSIKLGNKGYTIKKARGRGVKSGFVVTKNE